MPAGGRILAPGPGGQLPATSGEHRVRPGRHFCAGHAFSRALIRIAIEDLPQRFSRLALDLERPPEFRGRESRAPRRLDVVLP
jgi:cytochrome P450